MFHLGGSTKPFKLPPGYMHSRVMIITKIMLLVISMKYIELLMKREMSKLSSHGNLKVTMGNLLCMYSSSMHHLHFFLLGTRILR